jgi:hypothetical protein
VPLDQRLTGHSGSADVASGAAAPDAAGPGKRTQVQNAYPAQGDTAGSALADLEICIGEIQTAVSAFKAGLSPSDERIKRADLRTALQNAEKKAVDCGADPKSRRTLTKMFQLFIDAEPILQGKKVGPPPAAAAPAAAAPAAAAPPAAAPQAAAPPSPAPASAAPASAKPADPASAAAALAPIPSPDPLLPLPKTVEELHAKGGVAPPAPPQPGGNADGKKKKPSLPPGAKLLGDTATVIDPVGKVLNVVIKRGDEGPTTPTPEGGFEIHISKDVPPDIATDQILTQLTELATTPRQNKSNLKDLYGDAKEAHEELSKLAHSIAAQFKGTPSVPDAMKGEDRAKEKIRDEYHGETARLVDITRATVILNSYEDILAAITAIGSTVKIARVKDRFKTPVNGYRDVLMNIEMKNGHIVELQLHLQAIIDVKSKGEGHHLYDKIRKIEGAASGEKRPLTAEETAERDKHAAEMKLLYDAAFESTVPKAP